MKGAAAILDNPEVLMMKSLQRGDVSLSSLDSVFTIENFQFQLFFRVTMNFTSLDSILSIDWFTCLYYSH